MGPPSHCIAGAYLRFTRSGMLTSVASSQRDLVYQDNLRKTRELQKKKSIILLELIRIPQEVLEVYP